MLKVPLEAERGPRNKRSPGRPGKKPEIRGENFYARVVLDQTKQKLVLTFLTKVPLKAQKGPRKLNKSRKSGEKPEIRVM